MKIGVDYYPEQWDKSMWQSDATLMKKTGVSIVRLAEFAWCRIEPSENNFAFEWLDEIVDIFTKLDIQVVLCTPTNCPPLWLYEKYPDAVRTNTEGNKIATGIRGHRCYNNPDFLRCANRVIDEMTTHYADNKNVVAWQIDNELEANYCCCETCTKRYHDWLKKKYTTLENINKAYGNVVWSGEYSYWNQIKQPSATYNKAWFNPAFMLDYDRFASDDTIEYIKGQAQVIRKNIPDAKITTNTWFCENMIDFHKEFEELDFVSFDNYPPSRIPQNSEEIYSHSFHLDLMRGIKNQNFWIMEELSGGVGSWAPMSQTTLPNMIKGYSLQAIAHGADNILHFRWRTACKGAEMHWHGIIDHNNLQGRRFKEFASLCETAKELDKYTDTQIKSDVAILYSAEAEWAFKIQPQTDGFYYFEQMKYFHNAFKSCGINVDIISEKADISKYKVVCVPTLYICDEAIANKLERFAETGGTVILTNRSGVKDKHNNCIMSPLPTVFRKLAGCYVTEYNPLGYSSMKAKGKNGQEYVCKRWCDIIECENAQPLVTYAEDFYNGSTAVSENCFGKGKCYYVGTVFEKNFYQQFAKRILTEKSIEYFSDIPQNIEITCRENKDIKVYFIFNNNDKSVKFDFCGEKLSLNAFDFSYLVLNVDI